MYVSVLHNDKLIRTVKSFNLSGSIAFFCVVFLHCNYTYTNLCFNTNGNRILSCKTLALLCRLKSNVNVHIHIVILGILIPMKNHSREACSTPLINWSKQQ